MKFGGLNGLVQWKAKFGNFKMMSQSWNFTMKFTRTNWLFTGENLELKIFESEEMLHYFSQFYNDLEQTVWWRMRKITTGYLERSNNL